MTTDTANTEPQELADKHDGTEISRSQIQATVHYEVEFTDDQLEELPENIPPAEFAKNCATSRAENEHNIQSTLDTDAIAQETGMFDENVYTVVVTFRQ